MTIELHNGDCLEIMKSIPSQSVDMVLTDPPYNISQDYDFSRMRNFKTGLNFGKWDWEFDVTKWIYQGLDKLKKDGSLICFCSYRYLSHIIDDIERNGGVVKDVIVWQKTNPMPRNRDRRYVQDMEFAIWAVKSKNSKWCFNRQNKNYDRGFLQSAICSGKEKTNHTTQKPVSILENLIVRHTNENDVVLDCFMGSGSTMIACLNTNRKGIGIELDKHYFDVANKRIADHQATLESGFFIA